LWGCLQQLFEARSYRCRPWLPRAAAGEGAAIFEPFAIGFFGLSRWDEMLLRSMIRTIGEQTKHRWRIGGEQPSTLVFCHEIQAVPASALAHGGVAVVYAAQPNTSDTAEAFWLAAPPRLNALSAILDRVGDHLEMVRGRKNSAAAEGFFETIERLLEGRVGAYTLLAEGIPLAYVDVDRRAWRPLVATAALIEKLSTRITAERIATSMPQSEMESPLSQLLGLAAENMTHVPLLTGIDPRRPLVLKAWVEIVPDSPLAPLIPTAAALLRSSMTVTEIRARPRIPLERLSAWLNASWLLGKLQYAAGPAVAEPSVKVGVTGAGERGAEKLRGFVARLRSRLGMVGTPE